jgi:hypothetical protein
MTMGGAEGIMARTRKITLGALNIVLPPPHKAERNIALFEHVYALARKAKMRGDWVGLIGELKVEDDPQCGTAVRGEFYKYIELDKTRAWYNVVSRKPAGLTDIDRIVIPDELKPHFQFLPFVFFAKGHRLVCVTRDGQDTLSVRQVASILEVIFRGEEIEKEFGRVEITIEPSLETLDEILTLPKLRRLELDISPPNPDDFADFERDLFEDLDEQNAGSLKLELTAADGETLVPNVKTKKLAMVAQSNGKVVGIGGGRGKTRTLSTTQHPLEIVGSYDPDAQPRSITVFEKAVEVVSKLSRRA